MTRADEDDEHRSDHMSVLFSALRERGAETPAVADRVAVAQVKNEFDDGVLLHVLQTWVGIQARTSC